MEENRNEELTNKKPMTRQEKMERAMRRSFLLGAGSTLLILVLFLSALRFLGLGGFLVGSSYSDYKGIMTECGKYYQMSKYLEEEALTDYEPKALDDEVLKGVIEQLNDPYARYFTAEEYKDYIKIYDSSFVGIGVRYAEEDGKIIVKGIISGGPAEEAGIKEGDQLLKANGQELTDSLTTQEILLGEAGTSVKLTVLRNDQVLNFELVRAKIETESTYNEVIDKKNKIGYLYISIFAEDTAKDVKLAIKDLKNQGCEKVVIDLRSNGGGLTNEAYEVADYLLPAGIIDTEKDKAGKEIVHKSKAGDAGVKYVVLVDGYTASASEIVAAAIQDNKGGKIIGTKTFGKGVTQVMRAFRDGSAVKYTVTEYFRPNGKKVNKVGVTPDIIEEDNDRMMEIALDELKKMK